MEVPWVILNKSYILAFIKQQPYVVDLLALQKQALREHLSQFALPWTSRPLLVPMNTLIELMSQSQVFDPRLLSPEEKMELHQLLIKSYGQENKKSGLFKELTVEECRNLVHV